MIAESAGVEARPLAFGRAVRMVSVLTEDEERMFFGGDDWETKLGTAYELQCRFSLPKEQWGAFLEEVRPDVVLGAWEAPPLPDLSGGPLPLRYYCYVAGSVRQVIGVEHLRAGLLVTNWGGSIGRYIAEMALALTLGSLRNLSRHRENLRPHGGWREARQGEPEGSLFDRRVGLHGYGVIGRGVAALLAPFGTRTSAWDPYVNRETMERDGVEPARSLEDLFASSEVLVECCAFTPETKGIVNEAMLRRLPPGAVFVNIARGKLVDEAALIRVLREGRLRAGLDVFGCEPLPADSPLRGMENVVMTPHIAGNTGESRRAAGDFALANLRRFSRGEDLLSRITLEQYLRMT